MPSYTEARVIWLLIFGFVILGAIGAIYVYWYISVPLIVGVIAWAVWFARRSQGKRAAASVNGHNLRISQAIKLVVDTQSASRAMLERKLKLSPQLAAALLQELESRGIVGEMAPGGRRAVLMTPRMLAEWVTPLHAEEQASKNGTDEIGPTWEQLSAAAELIVEAQLGSTSMVQRKLGIPFAEARLLLSELEHLQVVGPANATAEREVLITVEMLPEILARIRDAYK